MTQVSEIIVSWTPETSGRVQSMQIQSRIVGTLQWSEVASGLDPTLGTITFASNAPGSDIEVRGRYRMVAGVFSPWVTMHITSGGVKVDYTTGIKGQPTTLAEINPGEGIKLEGAWNQAQTANGKADDALGNVADLQTANIAHLTSIANAELARIRARALDFPGPDGASTYTLHKREETAREDADGVFVETFELLGAVTPDGSGFILDDNTVKVTKTEAGATSLQSVKARFDGNEGAIEDVKQSVVDQNGAFSRAMTTIDARFVGNEGEISDIKEVFADENGTVARALLRVDANGRVIGFAATNDGRRGDFTVTADRFTIQDPDSGTAYFYADDTGKVIMRDVEVDKIKVGAVGFNQMTLGAVQKAAFYSLINDVSIARGSTVEICSITFFKEDEDSILEIQMFANCKSGDDLQFVGTILVDGMVMQTANVNIVLDNSNSMGEMPITPFAYVSGIARGTRTVSFKVYNRENDNVPLTVQTGSTLKVTELRKASIGTSMGSGAPISSGGGNGGGGYYGGNSDVDQQ